MFDFAQTRDLLSLIDHHCRMYSDTVVIVTAGKNFDGTKWYKFPVPVGSDLETLLGDIPDIDTSARHTAIVVYTDNLEWADRVHEACRFIGGDRACRYTATPYGWLSVRRPYEPFRRSCPGRRARRGRIAFA